ncbi:MAG: protease pro-enzyme activation domain-containing protein [Candidatus Acidiferrales bacterium]
MSRKRSFFAIPLAAVAIMFAQASPSGVKAAGSWQQTRPLIRQTIDESKRVTLRGNTRPEANGWNDRGPVEGNFQLQHMLLLLKRPAETEKALETYIDELQDKSSPNYHQWLTAEQLGEQYGLADDDINAITAWIESHGMTVNVVYPNRVLMDISGTAAQLREALRVEIHYLDVDGVKHFANMNDPQIPAALAPAVAGIVSMHDFRPHPANTPRTQYTAGGGEFLVVPADVATIYNLNPLFSEGYSGQGQTIVVVEDTNLFTNADWTTFRNTFGLSSYAGSLSTVHPAPPTGTNNCSNPGVAVGGNDGEAIIDAEYASAAAPSAAIEVASCADTISTFGGLIALQNLLNETSTPPAVVSISYGECEAENGAAANSTYNTTYQQAVTEGVSVFVSTGDEGAASCDAKRTIATHGIGVSGFASTPYNVAVGGTDFGDTVTGTTSTYWSATNESNYGSAKSYVPEIPWNDSCAGTLLAGYFGYAHTYGTTGFCNSTTGENFLTTVSGSGGPSQCATGSPATAGVVGGTCAGYAKPLWQSGLFGNPGDSLRDLPDVSLFAANNLWGHYYVFCWSHTPLTGAAACTGAPVNWSGAGGTSFSSPIMAGIQSLVNQKWGRQGNPNVVYYTIARAEYGTTGNATCNSSNQPIGRGIATACVFYDVTEGDMDVNCTGTHSCYLDAATNGVLSTSTTAYQPAYGAASGWDFATGIGTVDAYNLVYSTDW